jgi:hypothetical protein
MLESRPLMRFGSRTAKGVVADTSVNERAKPIPTKPGRRMGSDDQNGFQVACGVNLR